MASIPKRGPQSPSVAMARSKPSGFRGFLQKYGWSYAFVLPSMTTFTIFVLVPMIWAFIISFQR